MFENAKILPLKGSDNSKLFAAASYAGLVLGLLGVVISLLVFMTQKEDKYARFHALQSLCLFAAYFVAGLVLMVPMMILTVLTFGMAMLVMVPVMLLFGLAALAVSLYFAYQAYEGNAVKLPFIGDFVLKHL